MTIEYGYEFPYPRGLSSVPKIEVYLKSLHSALMAFQPKFAEAIENRLLDLLATHELGWTEVGSNPKTGQYRIKDIRLDSNLTLS